MSKKTTERMLFFCAIFIAFIIGALTFTFFNYIKENRVITFYGIIDVDDIEFRFENETVMNDAQGTARIDIYGNKIVEILSNMTYDDTLRVCNHEVLHFLLCMDAEEEYIDVLDNYVRFEICNKVVNEALTR